METFAALAVAAYDAIADRGWTTSNTHMMDETGAVDLNGAFAIALSIPLAPGRNEPVYDTLEEWFKDNRDFKHLLLAECGSKYIDDIRATSHLASLSTAFSKEEALSFLFRLIERIDTLGSSHAVGG